jgi:mono/diheme cytochrome c family protein
MKCLIPIVALFVFVGCSSEGGHESAETQEVLQSLSEETQLMLRDTPDVAGELAEVLRDYFGTPSRPRFALLKGWEELGFDPNGSPLEGARPQSDLVGTPAEAILEDNQRAWGAELAAIETGSERRLGPWRRRGVMNRNWAELSSQRGKLGKAEWERRATAFFAERYPNLQEAAQMFMPNCARCHGVEGGGDGPMSGRLFPKPRNYQRGVFKFAAVEDGAKPRRVDLVRTLVHGLPGSAMPSFRSTSLAELSALVDYVRYLSIRGEVEGLLLYEWEENELRPREAIAESYALVWERWLEAAEHAYQVTAPAPDSDPKRLALGKAVYLDANRGNCFSCHGEDGRGEGQSAIRIGEDGQRYALLRDEWGDFILPRDLTSGVFRGGTRREDVYARIHCGIPGTPMPALGKSLDAEGASLLSEGEKWALVDYVLSLSGQGPFKGR